MIYAQDTIRREEEEEEAEGFPNAVRNLSEMPLISTTDAAI